MIPLECDCGKTFRVGDDQAGRKVRCPVCQELLAVPGEEDAVAAYGVEQVRKCPQCKREWATDVVVCVECGWNFATSKAMDTTYDLRGCTLTGGLSSFGVRRRVTLLRGRKGNVSLSVERRWLFISVGTTIRDLADFNAIYIDGRESLDEETADYFKVELEGPDVPRLVVYRGSSEEAMHELVDTLKVWGRLEIKRR